MFNVGFGVELLKISERLLQVATLARRSQMVIFGVHFQVLRPLSVHLASV